MTNTAITQTKTLSRSAGRFSLTHLYRNWKIRRQIKKLQDRETRLLDDIGVTRDEVVWASRLPLSVNAADQLEEVSYTRRKAEQLMWL